jgi:hypothetical protein
MADRKVYVTVTTRLILRVDQGVEVTEVLENMDYDFIPSDNYHADVEDSEIKCWEITDSK